MSAINYDIRTSGSDEAFGEEAERGIEMESLRPLPRISIHAFCESEAMQRMIDRMGRDRRLAKVNLRVTSGSVAAAANMFSSTPTPNLIILETDAEPKNLLGELAPLAGGRLGFPGQAFEDPFAGQRLRGGAALLGEVTQLGAGDQVHPELVHLRFAEAARLASTVLNKTRRRFTDPPASPPFS